MPTDLVDDVLILVLRNVADSFPRTVLGDGPDISLFWQDVNYKSRLRQLLSLGTVSRTWRNLLLPFIVQDVRLSIEALPSFRTLMNAFDILPYLESFALRSNGSYVPNHAGFKQLFSNLAQCPSLVELHLFDLSSRNLATIDANFTPARRCLRSANSKTNVLMTSTLWNDTTYRILRSLSGDNSPRLFSPSNTGFMSIKLPLQLANNDSVTGRVSITFDETSGHTLWAATGVLNSHTSDLSLIYLDTITSSRPTPKGTLQIYRRFVPEQIVGLFETLTNLRNLTLVNFSTISINILLRSLRVLDRLDHLAISYCTNKPIEKAITLGLTPGIPPSLKVLSLDGHFSVGTIEFAAWLIVRRKSNGFLKRFERLNIDWTQVDPVEDDILLPTSSALSQARDLGIIVDWQTVSISIYLFRLVILILSLTGAETISLNGQLL